MKKPVTGRNACPSSTGIRDQDRERECRQPVTAPAIELAKARGGTVSRWAFRRLPEVAALFPFPMKLASLLTADQVILDMKSGNQWEALVELVEHLDACGRLAGEGVRAEVLETLRQREGLVSTGIGSGVAIPHALSDRIEEVTAVFGRSKTGIDFDALDHAPVHFVVLFLVPRASYALHLQTLAAIAKTFARREVRQRLAEAGSRDEIIEILAGKTPGGCGLETGKSA